MRLEELNQFPRILEYLGWRIGTRGAQTHLHLHDIDPGSLDIRRFEHQVIDVVSECRPTRVRPQIASGV